MEDLRIRIAGKEDAELIADLARKTFYDSFSAQNTKENMDLYLSEQFTREMVIAEVGAPGRIFLLATIGEEIAGYASMREAPQPRGLENNPAIEIVQLYAVQERIGHGVGKALMSRCLDIARELRKEYIWLGVWEQNQRAIAFYTKWGFERFGQHIFIVGQDPQTDWWMKKKL